MKKQQLNKYVFLGVLLMSVFFVSCKKKSPTVGFMLPHMTINRYIIEKEVFEKKIKELGGEVIFMSADNDEEKQKQQVAEIIEKGIDVLVLDPVNRFTAAGMVRAAHSKGIPVISYDRLVANCEVDNFLTFDAYDGGKQMVDYALKLIPSGNYVILAGDKFDINALLIDEAITKVLEPQIKSGKVKVIYKTYIEKYSPDDASFEIHRLLNLSSETPHVILAASNALVKGALMGLEKAGYKGDILIVGQGGEVFAIKYILTGQLAMTIYKPIKKLATIAAEISMKMANNENVDEYFKTTTFNGFAEIPTTSLEIISVDKNNYKSTIVADGMVTEAELAK